MVTTCMGREGGRDGYISIYIAIGAGREETV